MTERPIIFSGPMVRAILEGRKTQTRRVVRWNSRRADEVDDGEGEGNGFIVLQGGEWWPCYRYDGNEIPLGCPYGVPGDRLWVRETWQNVGAMCENEIIYAADDQDAVNRWRSPIHMPRWASRITLEVVGVRVERVQDITEEDARAEGVQTEADFYGDKNIKTYLGSTPWHRYNADACAAASAAESFMTLWESINGKGSWDANPWVWVVEYRRIEEGKR